MKPNKRLKLAEFNRNNILEAAKVLFFEQGVAKTTVDDIAKSADCSKATMYVYFKNKDDIYYHIVFEYMTIFYNEIQRCAESKQSFQSGYSQLCDSLVRLEQTYPMYFGYVLGFISVKSDERVELPILESIYTIGEKMNEVVKEFLQGAKEAGDIAEDIDIATAVFVLWSSICSLITFASNKSQYIEESLGIKREDFLKNGFAMILKMIDNRMDG